MIRIMGVLVKIYQQNVRKLYNLGKQVDMIIQLFGGTDLY